VVLVFWLAIAALASGVAAALAWPLLRRDPPAAARAEYDLKVYRDQLLEVDRDRARGLLSDAEAAAARTLVQRRALAADREGRQAPAAAAPRRQKFLALAIGAALPGAALVWYLAAGSPTLPGQPFAQRGPGSAIGAATAPPAGDAGAGQLDYLAQRLADRMAATPNDPEGWRLLGRTYLELQRYRESADAYRKAIALQPNDADYHASLGEALIAAADGLVTPAALESFRAAQAIDAGDPRARYFAGLAKAQAGDLPGALVDWRALLGDTPADAPWRDDLVQRVAELTRDIAGTPSAPAAPASPRQSAPGAEGALAGKPGAPSAPAAAPGPGPEEMRQAETMAPAERQAMIRSMVDRLAERLEKNPRDPEGWIRLARARQVLGDAAAATAALRRAVAANADDPAAQTRLREAARELGVDLGK
jgi:cytochrome c-type biogenesis protein CcmH